MNKKLALGLLILQISIYSPIMLAQEQTTNLKTFEEHLNEIYRIERALDAEQIHAQDAPVHVNTIAKFHSDANSCIQRHSAELQKLESDLLLLGDKIIRELGEVRRGRAELETDITKTEQILAACKLTLLRGQDLLDALGQLQQAALGKRLKYRGPAVSNLIQENFTDLAGVWNAVSRFIFQHSGYEHFPGGWLSLLLTLLPGLLLGWGLRRILKAWAQNVDAKHSLGSGLGKATLASFGHYAPHALMSGGATFLLMNLLTTEAPAKTFLVQLGFAFTAFFLLGALISSLLVPRRPAKIYLPLKHNFQRNLGRRLRVLAALSCFGILLFSAPVIDGLPSHIVQMLRAIYAPFIAMNLIWITWLTGSLVKGRSRWPVGFGLSLAVIASLIAEWLGFRNLSQFVAQGLVVTLLGLSMVWLSSYLLRDLYDGLDRGTENWQRWLRKHMGLRDNELMPGIFWLRSLTGLVLWGSFLLLELKVWGLPESGFTDLGALFTEGFQIGDFSIIPRRLLIALGTLALCLIATGWLKRTLANNWLLKSRLDRGAREAVVTSSGYLGVGIAIFITLSVAGVEFTNIAIIAGALSVGIGFGLQNIVNNFVSGLILLMERPVKTGDWIEVGNTEGYVKRISIRSTMIQTFDRADVIVPNSELISAQVTNWMLTDTYGRACVPVGVAYGSDTDKVRNILLEIANKHPQVISDPLSPLKPKVLFMSFGDSALNMELRVFIHNIDSRLGVVSDINFAIDAAFRRENISIPFPQRDLHIHNATNPNSGTDKPADESTQ